MGVSVARQFNLDKRNEAIYQALQGGSEVMTVASQYRLSKRTIRDINRRMGDRYAGVVVAENGNGKKAGFGELGISGLKRDGYGYIHEEFLAELRTPRQRYKVFEEMRQNSPIVAALLLAIALPIRKAEWRIEGEEGDERVDFLEGARLDMAHSWNDHITEALTMLPFGFAPFEIVYKKRQGDSGETSSQFNDGKIGWRKLAFRSQDSLLRWLIDDNGSLRGFAQQAWPDFKVREMPIEKMLLYRTTTEKGNPEGTSILRPAYVPYYYAKNLQAIEAIGVERDLAGLPMIKMPENAATEKGSTDLSKAEEIVRRVRQDEAAGAVIPFGWDLSLLASPGSKQIKSGEIIDRYNKQIALAGLAQFLMLGLDKVGSYALSKDKTDFFLMAVSAFADQISETFNQYAIPRLLKLNGMDTEDAPGLTHGALNAPDITQISDFLQKVGLGGFIQPDDDIEKWLRQQVNAPELTDEIIAERKAKPKPPVLPPGQPGQPGQPPNGGQPPTPPMPGMGPNEADKAAADAMNEMMKKMSLRQQITLFSADGRQAHDRIKGMPDAKLRQRVQQTSKGLTALNQKLVGQALKGLKSITDEEWQKAVEADAEKARANGSRP